MRLLAITICILALVAPLYGQDQTAASPEEILTGMTAENKLFLIRKHAFISDAMVDVVRITDSEMTFNNSSSAFFPLFFNPDTLGVPEDYYEDMAEQTIRNYMDVPPTTKLNGLFHGIAQAIKDSRREAVLQNPPIPTLDEIAVLRVVWEQDLATSSEIYAGLDSTTLVDYSAEGLQKLLKRMRDRGFLERKLISPRHEFTIFGVAKIEMSAKNRRNRLYLYWPLMSREKLMTMLDTKRYLTLASMKGRPNQSAMRQQKELEKKLLQVIR
jgi:predicted transcriptional regulator